MTGGQWSVVDGLCSVYRVEIGVREATGRNDGPRVAEYLRYCGLGEGYEWCAAFVSWCHGQAGYPEPRHAWAAALFPAERVVWKHDAQPRSFGMLRMTTPEPGEGDVTVGDVLGMYVASKTRIGPRGFWAD